VQLCGFTFYEIIEVIQNDEMYESYLQLIDNLLDSQTGTEEADEL